MLGNGGGSIENRGNLRGLGEKGGTRWLGRGGDKGGGEGKEDMRNGSGKRFYKGGQIYEGNWKDGKIDGQGTFKWDMATIMNWSGRRIM